MRPRGRFKCKNNALGTYIKIILTTYLIGRNITSAFPWPTLSVNLFGCLLIGLLYALSERCSLAQEYRLLLTVGLCGGFTTFSTFSNEALHLLRSGMHWQFAC